MRIGIFGGTFDPVHYGHLLLAECCREAARLDQVWWLPAATPPHKQQATLSPAEIRVQMLELAIGGHEPFVVSRLELDRGGLSYTVDTLQAIRAAEPDAELFLLLGADSLNDLAQWREPERICQLATPLVVQRAGHAEADFAPLGRFLSAERLAELRGQCVRMPQIELSSSELRQRAAAGRSLRFRTPRSVEMLIRDKGLYR